MHRRHIYIICVWGKLHFLLRKVYKILPICLYFILYDAMVLSAVCTTPHTHMIKCIPIEAADEKEEDRTVHHIQLVFLYTKKKG